MCHKSVTESGFSLLEVIISISIVAIIVNFAVPRYSHYIGNAKRLIVVDLLLVAAERMENFYGIHHTYVGANLGNVTASNFSVQQNYQIKILSATRTNFTLLATDLSATPDDPCNLITLDAQGNMSAPNAHDLTQCWQI